MKHLLLYKKGQKPTAAQLLQNQLCLNLADGKMYGKDLAGKIIPLGGLTEIDGTTYIDRLVVGEVESTIASGDSNLNNPDTISLTFDSQIFTTLLSGEKTPASILLTASVTGTDSAQYIWRKSGNVIEGATGNTFEVLATDIPDGTSVTYKVTAGYVSDTVTISSLVEASGGISAIVSNEAHVIRADWDGTTVPNDYIGSGTTLELYVGATKQLFSDTTTPAIGYFNAVATSASGITVGARSSTTSSVVYGDHSNMTDGSGYIEYTFYYNNSGSIETLTKRQSFTKTANGENGAPGTPGAAGERGAGFYTRAVSGMSSGYWNDTYAGYATPGANQLYDVVTLYNPSDTTQATTKHWDGNSWETAALLVHGDMIVTGTIITRHLQAGSITTDKIDANAVLGNRLKITDASTEYATQLAYFHTSSKTLAIQATNDNDAANSLAIFGEYGGSDDSGIGVRGHADKGYGIYGDGPGIGVQGVSNGYAAVAGTSSTGAAYAVTGSNTHGGYGLHTQNACWFEGSAYPFTAGHLTISDISMDIGDIIVSVSSIIVDISNTIVMSARSDSAKQITVFGVLADKKDANEELERLSLLMDSTEPLYTENDEGILVLNPTTSTPKPEYQYIFDLLTDDSYAAMTNSIGEGGINVCEENGNITSGDYLCTSDTEGKGMKQDDDLLHNYTVGKSLQDVVWADEEDGVDGCFIQDGAKCKMIACTYHCG